MLTIAIHFPPKYQTGVSGVKCQFHLKPNYSDKIRIDLSKTRDSFPPFPPFDRLFTFYFKHFKHFCITAPAQTHG